MAQSTPQEKFERAATALILISMDNHRLRKQLYKMSSNDVLFVQQQMEQERRNFQQRILDLENQLRNNQGGLQYGLSNTNQSVEQARLVCQREKDELNQRIVFLQEKIDLAQVVQINIIRTGQLLTIRRKQTNESEIELFYLQRKLASRTKVYNELVLQCGSFNGSFEQWVVSMQNQLIDKQANPPTIEQVVYQDRYIGEKAVEVIVVQENVIYRDVEVPQYQDRYVGERTVDKVVWQDQIVEKPIKKLQYVDRNVDVVVKRQVTVPRVDEKYGINYVEVANCQDRLIARPVEVIVYQDRIVGEKIFEEVIYDDEIVHQVQEVRVRRERPSGRKQQNFYDEWVDNPNPIFVDEIIYQDQVEENYVYDDTIVEEVVRQPNFVTRYHVNKITKVVERPVFYEFGLVEEQQTIVQGNIEQLRLQISNLKLLIVQLRQILLIRIEMDRVGTRTVAKVVYVEKYREKPVQKVVFQDVYVDRPVQKMVYRDVYRDVEIEKVCFREVVIEKEVLETVYVDHPVQKFVDEILYVDTPKTVERLSATVTWVDKFHDVITEKLAFVDKFIERVVKVNIPRQVVQVQVKEVIEWVDIDEVVYVPQIRYRDIHVKRPVYKFNRIVKEVRIPRALPRQRIEHYDVEQLIEKNEYDLQYVDKVYWVLNDEQAVAVIKDTWHYPEIFYKMVEVVRHEVVQLPDVVQYVAVEKVVEVERQVVTPVAPIQIKRIKVVGTEQTMVSSQSSNQMVGVVVGQGQVVTQQEQQFVGQQQQYVSQQQFVGQQQQYVAQQQFVQNDEQLREQQRSYNMGQGLTSQQGYRLTDQDGHQ